MTTGEDSSGTPGAPSRTSGEDDLPGRTYEHLSAEEFVDRLSRDHRAPVTAYVHRMVGDHHLAQDVAQETFLRAWRQSERLQAGNGSIRGWLLTVARNLAIDRLRSAAGRRELTSDTVTEPWSSHDDHAVAAVGDDHVRELLNTLPVEQRAVLYWSVVVGLTSAETAHELGIPAGTVKSRRHYALRLLRTRLTEPRDEPAAA